MHPSEGKHTPGTVMEAGRDKYRTYEEQLRQYVLSVFAQS